MSVFRMLSLFTAVLAAILLVQTPEGLAQGKAKAPVIALVDYAAIVQNSKAGQSVRDQVEKQRSIYLAEIQKLQAQLDEARKELEQQQSVLAQDVFAKKVQEFRRQELEAKQTENSYRRSLDQMQGKGFREIEVAINEILEEIAKSRGIDIVMNAGAGSRAILKASKDLFITDDVVKELDRKLPSVAIPAVAE